MTQSNLSTGVRPLFLHCSAEAVYQEPDSRFSVSDALRSFCRAAALLCVSILVLPLTNLRAQLGPDSPTEFVLRAPFPLGLEAFHVMPSKTSFYIFGSIENHDFDGIHVYRFHRKSTVTRDGVPVRHYPENVVFRVTASTITPEGQLDPPSELDFKPEISQLLSGLRFRLLVLRGVEKQELQPSEVRMIGIPSDQPAQERIYRVSFHTHEVPTDARLALQVYTPSGERITRFRIELL